MMKKYILILILPLVYILANCSSYYKAKPVHKKHHIVSKKYTIKEPLMIDNIAFQYIDQSMLSEKIKKDNWHNIPVMMQLFSNALTSLGLTTVLNNNFENVIDENLKLSFDYNPVIINKENVVRLAQCQTNKLKLMPLISIYNHSVDMSFENNREAFSSTHEYIYRIHLSVYIILNNQVIYFNSGQLKGFETEKDSFEHSRSVWYRLVKTVMQDYVKNAV